MKFIRRKAGSYIMEAALVLPISILAVITVILVIMFFYFTSASQCSMHMALRISASSTMNEQRYDPDTGLLISAGNKWDGEIKESGSGFEKEFSGQGFEIMKKKGILEKHAYASLKGSCHAISGSSYVLFCGLKNSILPKTDNKGVD